jgi:hypothetical protein
MIVALQWIVLALAGIMVVSGIIFVRRQAKGGVGTEYATLTSLAIFTLATVAVPLFGWSPFHLLWIFPASFVIGILSMLPPFRLLWSLGKAYGFLCCL